MQKTEVRSSQIVNILLIGLLAFSGIGFPAVAESASRSSARPSITLTAPASKSSFAKEGSGIIPIAWSAKNVPEDTLVILELKHRKLERGGVGGGKWQQEIVTGDSTGNYNWDIETDGTASPGTYRVRASLQECVPGDCGANPFFPGVRKTKTYATSRWVSITITQSARNESSEASRTIGTRPSGDVAVTLAMNGQGGDFFTLSAGSAPSFNYFPSGDVESCTITGYYQGGKRTIAHGWKNGIKSGDFGRFTFSLVEAYPLLSLQSVEVVCGNANYRASDTIRFSVDPGSIEADFKILTGKSGNRAYKKGVGTKVEAESYCTQAYNDPEIHKFTRVQCYWDGERFEDVTAFKG